MTTSLPVQQRTWISPSATERLTWAEVYALVRSNSALYSEAALPAYRLTEAVDREIGRLSPYTYTEEIWQSVFTQFVDYIYLPWRPVRVVSAGWQTDTQTEIQSEIDGTCWQVVERQWRWIGPRYGWPGTSVNWYLHVLGRPRPSTEEPTYCTVAPELLLPFVEIELDRLTALERGGDPQQVNQIARTARQQQLLMIPKRTTPPSRPHIKIPTMSNIVFYSWGQQDLTFADFVIPE